MSTDEEYLDSLLKSMEENPVANRTDFPSIFQEEEPLKEKTVFKDIEPEETESFTERSEEEPKPEEFISDDKEIELVEPEPEETPVLSEEEAWKESLDELLAGAEDGLAEKESEKDEALDEDELSSLFDALENDQDNITDKQSEINELEGLDVTDIIDHMEGTDEDLNEINDLLKKTDLNEAIDTSTSEEIFSHGDVSSDDDMLELLNSMNEEPTASGEEEITSKKKKKAFSLPFGKKKESKQKTDASEENSANSEEDGKEKKKGFWHRLMEELTREEEEPENQESVDENEEILKELEAEDQIKEKKKNKKEKKKKDKKGKKSKNASADEENEDASGEEEGKKKKKKPKREKKEKAKGPKEKSPKILSKKMLFSMIAFCATIIAAIVLLSIFLPDYADKKNARTAFYTGDYSKVYELLYDKNLNQSDQLIFERANVVLKLQRRLDSYELNKKIGQEAEALDALLQGTLKYEEILSDATYGAEEELQALYRKILDHLEQDYGIGEEEARTINSYDSETYSRKIYSVVNGEDFSDLEQEAGEEGKTADNDKLQDVLPEEEDLIQEEP
ncbi:MAG: hypothetical protein MR992_12350 [Lachnospiraceae bacterium]|nr:hypothetical protein [Lachnospiraceae bacterium]MDD7628100.1 hypothetical protein [Lachnospiraceae bacterium]MDY4118089.1 hypothetical protein [Lachnospiraceae bacterium]